MIQIQGCLSLSQTRCKKGVENAKVTFEKRSTRMGKIVQVTGQPQKKRGPLLSIESELVNRDPYIGLL